MSDHIIIGIHGLANKPDKDVLQLGWEVALCEGLILNEHITDADINFKSVYWADLMYDSPDMTDATNSYHSVNPADLKRYKDSWRDIVRIRLFGIYGSISDMLHKMLRVSLAGNLVLKVKLKDLAMYYDDEVIRFKLRDRLRKVIIANEDKKIMIIAHSMGTIIAYDVLRVLGKVDPSFKIEHFVTIGSPLGLPHVKSKIAKENYIVRTPSIVQRWTNFADRRDPVAVDVHLADDYGPNDNGVRVKDDLVLNDWGGLHHKSYGYLRTPEMSEVVKNFL